MTAIHYYWFFTVAGLLLVVLLLVLLLRSTKRVTELYKKAVLITGCDSGFGFNLACRLDQLGVKVFAGCLYPNGSGAKKLKSMCSDSLQLLQMDVTKDDQIQDAVSVVSNSLEDKVLWGVVNNAGIGAVGCLEWMSPDVIMRLFDVNALGPFRVTKAFLPFLRKSEGRVVIVASLGGVYPLQGAPAYSMSKHAAVSLAHSLRRELAQFEISVHLVNPGSYRTPILNIPIVEELKSHWKILPEEVRSAYDEQCIYDYEADVLNAWMQYAKSESKIYEVTDAILDSILAHRPKTIYIPGLLAKFQYLMLCITPIELADYFMNFCLRLRRLTKKTDQQNNESAEV